MLRASRAVLLASVSLVGAATSLRARGGRSPELDGTRVGPLDPSVLAAAAAAQSSGEVSLVDLVSGDARLVEAAAADPGGFSLNVASHLQSVTGAPLARFALFLPDPSADDTATTAVLSCRASVRAKIAPPLPGTVAVPPPLVAVAVAGAEARRWAAPENTTFECLPFSHVLNSTQSVLLQRQPLPALPAAVSSSTESAVPLRGVSLPDEAGYRPGPAFGRVEFLWEVVIEENTGIEGDWLSAPEVQRVILQAAAGTPDSGAARTRLRDGTWSQRLGPDAMWLRFFPDTRAALPGQLAPLQADISHPLGLNAGGHGEPRASPPEIDADAVSTTPPPSAAEVARAAEKINFAIRASVEELSGSMARASAAHLQALTENPFQPPTVLPSGALLPTWVESAPGV